jgi:hypothetical protein
MEPIQILEAIKEDMRDKFDGDPLMMRTMNLVITEYKARSERLHKPVIGGPASASVSEVEQLGNEAWAKGVSDGCECTILTRKDECKEYTGCPKYMNRV